MKPFAALAAALVITLAPALALAQEAIREVRGNSPTARRARPSREP